MPLTMREFLAKIGREEGILEGIEKGRSEGIEKSRMENLSALRKAFRKRAVPFDDYQAELQALPNVAAIGEFIVDFMAAENAKTFLKNRFGH